MYIKKDQRALLLYKGEYRKLMLPGAYIKPPLYQIEMYSIKDELSLKSASLEILLHNEDIACELQVLHLTDTQVALHFENGNFRNVLKPGKHAYWKSIIEHTFLLIELSSPFIDSSVSRLLLMRPELAEYLCSYSIEPYQNGILYIDKAFREILEPGNYFYWKGSQSVSVVKVDLRQQQMEVTGQEIMTKDKIPLRVNFFCQYRITDIIKCIVNINEYEKQFYILLQLAIREYIGSFVLDEILEKKEEIGAFIGGKIKDNAALYGITVINTGIKDIILPGEIKDILNQVLIAEKKSQANVIMRREETASTRSLLNTAKLLEDNKILYHLKELEYIERISEKISQLSVNGCGTHLLEELKRLFIPAG